MRSDVRQGSDSGPVEFTTFCASEEEQLAFGRRLAQAVGPRGLIFLDGDLGAGKTTLVRGFLRACGHDGAVRSPTYTLIEPYEAGGRRIYHLDLYRLSDGEELEYLGLRDLLDEQAVLLVEWPERGEGWLPPADLTVKITYQGSGRQLRLSAATSVGKSILDSLEAECPD